MASQRTAPEDAMASLAEWLNLYQGQTVPINKLSENTGLAWATVRKYVDLMAKMQHLAPGVKIMDDGVHVQYHAPAFEETLADPMATAAFLLYVTQRNPALRGEIKRTGVEANEGFDQLLQCGFAEKTNKDQWKLTKPGWSFANSVYSDILLYAECLPEDIPEFHGQVIQNPEGWQSKERVPYTNAAYAA